jgi:ABC-type transport system involved in cytochrome c biogenesis permease subunit
MKQNILAWVMVALALAWVGSSMRAPSTAPDTLQIHEFGRIPVVEGGRVKPMDTIARTHLRIVANRETFKDTAGESLPAIAWLLDVETEFADKEQRARKHPVFRIDHPSIRDALGLPAREGYRYSIEDFGDKLGALAEPLKKAHERKDNNQPLDPYENQLMEFERHLGYYERLARFSSPHVIPPHDGQDWLTLGAAVPKGEQVNLDPYVDSWKQMLLAYGSKDVKKFNEAVARYREKLVQERPADVKRAALESQFNALDPFNKAKWLYVVAFILAALAWLGWSVPLNRASVALLVVIFVLHTVALGVRMYLSGRPPVTNLYSSAIFIGWGCAAMGLVLERIYKLGIGSVLTSVSGFVTLQIAHILAADGDTMEVLQAVLDTQFWLATHVTSITLGYAATYVAGLLGMIYIIRGVFTSSLTPELGRRLAGMTYGVTCFAMFFSFVGTVLGGLWADDSWGRFWGWDPKENGALMIVLWNALVLHARWGGIARERGMAMLAVFGNIVVSWSWFGVNQLGVGLHSYGFTNGVTMTLVGFAFSQAALIGCASFPREIWRSKLPLKEGAGEEKIKADA